VKQGGGNKVGEKIVDERVTLYSDPPTRSCSAARGISRACRSRRQVWIENGVLKQLIYSRFWAKKQGKSPPAARARFKMAGGTQSVDDLVAGTTRGILVTRLWYLREVDPRTILYTGLTRDGTFLIENGGSPVAAQLPLQRVAALHAQQPRGARPGGARGGRGGRRQHRDAAPQGARLQLHQPLRGGVAVWSTAPAGASPVRRARHTRSDRLNDRHLRLIFQMLDEADTLRLPLWLQGGWAVDARLGRITREHHDIDFAVPSDRLEEFESMLARLGAGTPHRVDYGFLVHVDGVLLDCEPCIPAAEGYELGGVPAGACPEAREGVLRGRPVHCASWTAIAWDYFHYLDEVPLARWPAKDRDAWALVRAEVGVATIEHWHRRFRARARANGPG
jgi:aminoglycoside 2''-adenylyltransferase